MSKMEKKEEEVNKDYIPPQFKENSVFKLITPPNYDKTP